MSVTLGALVIAISTEFSVLLSARYSQERDNGAGPARAIEMAYASTGAAVLASGATAIAGFAALAASDIRMLRDFGIVTVVDLTVSLVGVMLVLPAALLWAEEHGPFSLRDLDPRPWLRRASRPAHPGGRAVSDDRFGDLGDEPENDDARAVGDRLAERDRTHPEPMRRPEVPRPGNKYAWLVGILALMGLSVLLFTTTLPNSGEGHQRPRAGLPAEGLRLAVRARGRGGRAQRLPARAGLQRDERPDPRVPGAHGGSGQPLRPAPPAGRAHLRVRPRRRLPAAGGPHRAGARGSARGELRHRLLQPQGPRRAAEDRRRRAAGASRWPPTTARS